MKRRLLQTTALRTGLLAHIRRIERLVARHEATHRVEILGNLSYTVRTLPGLNLTGGYAAS